MQSVMSLYKVIDQATWMEHVSEEDQADLDSVDDILGDTLPIVTIKEDDED